MAVIASFFIALNASFILAVSGLMFYLCSIILVNVNEVKESLSDQKFLAIGVFVIILIAVFFLIGAISGFSILCVNAKYHRYLFIFVLIVSLVVAILFLVVFSAYDEETALKNSLRVDRIVSEYNYYVVPIDIMQQTLKCCGGFLGPLNYAYLSHLPRSCCPSDKRIDCTVLSIYTQNCPIRVGRLIMDEYKKSISATTIIVLLLVIGIASVFFLLGRRHG